MRGVEIEYASTVYIYRVLRSTSTALMQLLILLGIFSSSHNQGNSQAPLRSLPLPLFPLVSTAPMSDKVTSIAITSNIPTSAVLSSGFTYVLSSVEPNWAIVSGSKWARLRAVGPETSLVLRMFCAAETKMAPPSSSALPCSSMSSGFEVPCLQDQCIGQSAAV